MNAEPLYMIIAGVIVGIIVFAFFILRSIMPLLVYAYPNARISAIEARLLPAAKVRETAKKKSIQDAFESLSGTDYSKMNLEPDNVEMSFNQYFVDHIADVWKFSPKSTQPIFEYYLREWDIYNVKNALHAAFSNSDFLRDEVKRSFVNVNRIGLDKACDIASSSSVSEAAEKMKDTEYYPVIAGHIKEYGGNKNTGMLDCLLDKYNISRLCDDAKERHKKRRNTNNADSTIIGNYCCAVADFLNINIALRSIFEGWDTTLCREQIINSGLFINDEKRERMFSCSDIECVRSVVCETAYKDAFNNGYNEFKKTGRIDGILDRIEDIVSEHIKELSLRYPFSAAVVARYLMLKKKEVLLLRSVFKGIKDNVRFEIDDDMKVAEGD